MNLFDYFDTHKVYQNGMNAETTQYLHQQISIAETAVKKKYGAARSAIPKISMKHITG